MTANTKYKINLPTRPYLIATIQENFIFVLSISSFCYFLQFHANPVWKSLFNLYGDNVFIVSLAASAIIAYWIFSFPLALIDFIPILKDFFRKYKIQAEKYVSYQEFIKVAKLVIFNQLIITPPFIWLFYVLWKSRGGVVDSCPTASQFLMHFGFFLIVEEIGFYYSHRMLHTPKLYKRIHKIHHEFIAPIGLAAIYAHPIEHLLSNLFPLFVGPLISVSHPLTICFWFAIAALNTVNAHCGYDLPGFPGPYFHDYHHFSFNSNYGIFGILDKFHGTSGSFLKALAARVK